MKYVVVGLLGCFLGSTIMVVVVTIASIYRTYHDIPWRVEERTSGNELTTILFAVKPHEDPIPLYVLSTTTTNYQEVLDEARALANSRLYAVNTLVSPIA